MAQGIKFRVNIYVLHVILNEAYTVYGLQQIIVLISQSECYDEISPLCVKTID